MDVEHFVRDLADGLHHIRAKRDVGDEMAVHDIDVNHIAARSHDRAHVVAKPREIGGKD